MNKKLGIFTLFNFVFMTPVFAEVWNLGVPYYNIDECINACRYSQCSDPLSSSCQTTCENDSSISKMRIYDLCLTSPENAECSTLLWSDYKCPYSVSENYFDVYKYSKNCVTNCTTTLCKEKCEAKVSELNSCNECIAGSCSGSNNCVVPITFQYPENTNEQDCERAKDALGVCRQDAERLGISVSLPVYGQQYTLSSLGTNEVYSSADSEAIELGSWNFGSGSNQYGVGTLNCGFYKTAKAVSYSEQVKTTTNSSLIADAFFAEMMQKRNVIQNTSCKYIIETKLNERVKKLRSVWTASYRPQCLTDLYVRSNLYNNPGGEPGCPAISACTAESATCRECYCSTWCSEGGEYSQNCMICNNLDPNCLPISQCASGPNTSSRCACNCSEWCNVSGNNFNLNYCLACGSSNPCSHYLLCGNDDNCRCECQRETCQDGSSLACMQNCEGCQIYSHCEGNYECNCQCSSACASSGISEECRICKCSVAGWNSTERICNDQY